MENNNNLILDKQPAGWPVVTVELQKESGSGFGFNIVGGIDKPHIPGHPDFFVSRIRPGSIAFVDGRLSVGDKIVSVNGIDLIGKSHDEAVKLFRSVKDLCSFVVVKGAEQTILSDPSPILLSSSATPTTPVKETMMVEKKQQEVSANFKSPTTESTHSQIYVTAPSTPFAEPAPLNGQVTVNANDDSTAVENGKPTVDSRLSGNAVLPPLANGAVADEFSPLTDTQLVKSWSPTANEVKKRTRNSSSTVSYASVVAGTTNEDDEGGVVRKPQLHADADDQGSTISMAVSSSIGGDLPRTPKRSAFFLDSSEHSLLSEVLYVTTGVAALGLAAFFGYRFMKRNH